MLLFVVPLPTSIASALMGINAAWQQYSFMSAKTWKERKQHTIDWVKIAPLNIKALIVADKLDNLHSMYEDFLTMGDKLWKVFKRGKEKQKWYFTKIAENASFGLREEEIPSFFKTYEELVCTFFYS